ncbi:MAG: hypothetical protein J5930_03070 [Treponema sp.]|nr:hypothetical protein [Treponema sp.]
MKGKFFSAALVFTALHFSSIINPISASAQGKASDDFVQQVVIPPEVYVGDKAQLQYTFNSPIDFFAQADPSHLSGDTLYINPAEQAFRAENGEFDVSKVSLHRNGMTYTLVVDFTAWTPGSIDFPPFDLNAYCRMTTEGSSVENLVSFEVDLEPLTVPSLSERMNSVGLRPPASPLLIPGTNYIVWTLIVTGVIILFLLGLILVKFPVIREAVYSIREKMGLLRNSRVAKRHLKKLLLRKSSDMEFARSWQQIMRSYLSARFGTSFSSVTTRNLAMVINRATGNMMSEEQEGSLMDLVSLFIRTDYILFAKDSIESQQLPREDHEAAFTEGERNDIVEISKSCIDGMESSEKNQEALL